MFNGLQLANMIKCSCFKISHGHLEEQNAILKNILNDNHCYLRMDWCQDIIVRPSQPVIFFHSGSNMH